MRQARSKSRKKLQVLQLAAVIFFTVSGGPYGIESLFSHAGSHAAILLLLITPMLWDIPTILTVLELNSMMPVNGGYYQWVKRALGIRWAFYEGFWTWLYTFVDLAVYPVLFVEYLSFFNPQFQVYKVPVCLFIIWSSALLNIMGIVPVGKISMILTGLVLAPFVLIWTYSFSHSHGAPIAPTLSLKGIGLPAIGMGVITVMWNFFGWDNSTTYAGEVDKPVRSYIISFVIAFLTVIGVYLITSLAVLHSGIDFKALEEKGFPALGIQLGHPWLARLLAIGGMASMVGLFSAVLLSVSRVPKVMADDGLMPEKLNALHSRFHTPYVSIIFSALIISLMILRNFDDLIIMDVTLYGAGLFLEFISLIVLRIKYPKENRPFKIPLKTGGLILMYILSFGIYALGLAGAFLESEKTKIPAIAAVLALFSAELVWQIIVRWKLKPPEIKVKNNPRIRLKR